jgi:hypothetical protein
MLKDQESRDGCSQQHHTRTAKQLDRVGDGTLEPRTAANAQNMSLRPELHHRRTVSEFGP